MSETTNYGTPGLLSLMREAMGAEPLLQKESASEAFSVGTAAVGAVTRRTWEGLTRRNEETGAGEGVVAYLEDLAYRKMKVTFANMFRRRML